MTTTEDQILAAHAANLARIQAAMQPELMPVPETPAPPLEIARRKLEAIESVPPCYLKFTVERTSRAQIYVRVAPGTKPKDVPQRIIEAACREIYSTDWGNEHEYSGYNARQVDAAEAEAFAPEDATGVEDLRAEVLRLEKEALK